MDAQAALLRDIDAFIAEREIAETTFGRRAANDGKFVARLRSGGGITVKTVESVRNWMATSSVPRRAQAVNA